MAHPDPNRPEPVDLAHHAHLTGVYAPQRTEVDVADLDIIGELPADLYGSYLRNGPNPRFDPIGSFLYPLDGDAMVHRITFDGGRASYSNRFVRTPMVRFEEQAGQAVWSGLTDGYTPPASAVGDELAGTVRHLPDINIVEHAGRLMAMAEADKPYRLDRTSLATLGQEDCDGAMRVGSTAHPKIDPRTGEMVLFNYTLEAPYLTWSSVGADGQQLRPPTAVDGLDAPMMIHDMALTDAYVVLFVNPLVFDLERAMMGGALLSWRPDDGTRIAFIPRDGGPVRWIHTDPFWVWHFANAFDNPDGTVMVDYIEWSYPSGFASATTPNVSYLTRAVCNPATGAVSRTRVSERTNLEFPRIDDRRVTTHHDVIAAVGKADTDSNDLDSLWFHDLTRGSESCYSPGVAIGEPIFMPGVGGNYWGAIGTDPQDMCSRFYLLAADDPAAGPVATITLPIRVPAGLHGTWLPQ
ncbi:carotenoid oxygenase family protein [Kitasatospora arboriphila]|uniref:carotenoid oxygenase family protein n=1 Tax=Kitasatospora arboriphila TaxID=258052 RepID=UPI0004BFB15E|nr:carotenoid oxygenase family protein [Kitasatospora arboriphila]